MNKGHIYVVFGSNAVMITHRYSNAVYCRDKYFLSPCMIRKYETIVEAEDNAYDHLDSIAPIYKVLPEKFELDKIYAVSKLPDSN